MKTVADGLAKTIRRGKKTLAVAETDTEPANLHEMRKRAEDLRYQLGLLPKAWPEVLQGYQDSAKAVEQRLGGDHNLVVLKATLRRDPEKFGGKKRVREVEGALENRQSELREKALEMGRLLYGEKPKTLRRRIESCYE